MYWVKDSDKEIRSWKIKIVNYKDSEKIPAGEAGFFFGGFFISISGIKSRYA